MTTKSKSYQYSKCVKKLKISEKKNNRALNIRKVKRL